MKAIIEIDMDNAAFEDYPADELLNCLDRLAAFIQANGLEDSKIRDTNGNTVGTFRVEEGE